MSTELNTVSMNGAMVIARARGTIFIRIPRELQQPINSGCACDYCLKAKATDPNYVPRWDTQAIAIERPATGNDYSWTVHCPDPSIWWEIERKERDYAKRKAKYMKPTFAAPAHSSV